jgi:hypothetical protein
LVCCFHRRDRFSYKCLHLYCQYYYYNDLLCGVKEYLDRMRFFYKNRDNSNRERFAIGTYFDIRNVKCVSGEFDNLL